MAPSERVSTTEKNNEEDTIGGPEYITDDDMLPTFPGAVSAVLGTKRTSDVSVGGKFSDSGKLRLAPPLDPRVADMDASFTSRTSIARLTGSKTNQQLRLASASCDEERGLNIQVNDLPAPTTNEEEEAGNAVELQSAAVALEATLVEDDVLLEHDREKLREEIVSEILGSSVYVEAAPIEDEKRIGSRRTSYAVAALAILMVAIGVVVAVMVAIGAPDQEDPSKGATETTEINVSSPEPSMQPTSAPTISIANLNNSRFEEAHPLVLGADPYLVDSSNAQAKLTYFVDCGPVASLESFGLWYIYRAKRSGPVTVVSCGASLQVFVTPGPDSLNCLFDTMDYGDVDDCDGDSVSWMAEAGFQYQVLLETNPTNATRETPETASDYSIKIVDHSQCQYAFGLGEATSTSSVYAYTTDDTTDIAAIYHAGDCGGASQPNGPGVWYTVTGTGKAISVSTCNENTNFDTQVSVFRGSCDGLVCVNGNNDFCGLQSTVAWASVESETYYILVHGTDGATGDFELVLSGDADRRENDFCETAIEVNATEMFDFIGASHDPETRYCDVENHGEDYPIGIWYTVTGDGGRIEINVSWSTLTPVRVHLFGGVCGSLECLLVEVDPICIGGGVAAGCSTIFYIESSVEGMIYYILLSTVESFDIDVGGLLVVVRSSN